MTRRRRPISDKLETMDRRALGCVVLLAGCGFSARLGDGDAPPLPGDGADVDAPIVTPAWQFKRKLTIDNAGIGALTSFALAVHLDGTRIRYAATAAQGADVRIGDAAGNFLPYEIERWDPNGTSIIWVRVPAIAAGTTTDLWLYHGNAMATDAQDAPAVWDSDYVGVWHMADGTDATGRNASTNNGATATAGKIGSALQFAAADAHVDTASTAHLTRWTIELWMNPVSAASASGATSLVSRFPNYMLLWSCNGATFCRKVMYDGNQSGTYNAGFDAAVGAWTHVVGRYDGTAVRGYVDGIESGSMSTTDTPMNTAVTAKIGSRMDLQGDFVGAIDEVRISNVARSTDYIRAHVRSTSDTYLTYGAEQANE